MKRVIDNIKTGKTTSLSEVSANAVNTFGNEGMDWMWCLRKVMEKEQIYQTTGGV